MKLVTRYSERVSHPDSIATLAMDHLVGRRVIDREGRSVGRIQELRAERRGSEWIVTHYLIGVAGVLERLGVGMKLLVGWRASGYIVRTDQVDLSDPHHARLTCSRNDLEAA